jgi:O-antigen/teichoic acid export membrane protein
MELTRQYIVEKWQHAGFQKYFRNTGWLFTGRAVSLVANFFVGTYIARYLGPSDFGLMNFAISFAGIFLTFSSLGVDSLLIKGLTQNPDQKGAWLGTGFTIRIIGAVAGILVVTASSIFLNHEGAVTNLVLAYSLFSVFQSFNVIDFYFQSQVRAKNSMISYIVTTVISSFVKLGFIWAQLGPIFFVLSYSIDHFLMMIGYVWFYRKDGGRMREWRIDMTIVKYLAKNCWPFILSSVSVAVYFDIDQVFLKYFVSESAVGFYSAAVRLSEAWLFIPGMICTSIFPAIVNAHKTSMELLEARMQKLYSLMFYISAAIVIPICIGAPLIIRLLYGAAYVSSVPMLQIYIISIIGNFMTTALSQYLFVMHRLTLSFMVHFLGMAINVGLNLYVIPRYGALGAAIVNTISYILPFIIILALPSMKSHRTVVMRAIFLRHEKNEQPAA